MSSVKNERRINKPMTKKGTRKTENKKGIHEQRLPPGIQNRLPKVNTDSKNRTLPSWLSQLNQHVKRVASSNM